MTSNPTSIWAWSPLPPGSKLGAGLAIWEQEDYNINATRIPAYPTAISQLATRMRRVSNTGEMLPREVQVLVGLTRPWRFKSSLRHYFRRFPENPPRQV